MENVSGKKRLSVKDKMLAVFESLERRSAEDIEKLEPKERVKLMLELGKVLMPKSDVDAKDEKLGRVANSDGMTEYFGMKVS